MHETQAAELWDTLNTHLTDAAITIRTIINTNAWEPLGYNGFTEAWRKELGDTPIANRFQTPLADLALRGEPKTGPWKPDEDNAALIDGIHTVERVAILQRTTKAIDERRRMLGYTPVLGYRRRQTAVVSDDDLKLMEQRIIRRFRRYKIMTEAELKARMGLYQSQTTVDKTDQFSAVFTAMVKSGALKKAPLKSGQRAIRYRARGIPVPYLSK